MGNQGMTNWKFSAFFVIALMLVAGLFNTTAMAADGDGTITVATPSPDTNPRTARLEAGGDPIELAFTYMIANPNESQMNGGLFQMVIPDGWAFAAAVAADNTLAGIASVTGQGTNGAHLSTPGSSTVRVRLGDNWGTGSSAATLTITLSRIGIPNPDRLTDGNRDDRYEEYEFTAYSRTRSGRLRELDNIVLREGDTDPDTNSPIPDDGDNTPDEVVRVTSGQPFVRVGNVGSGKGTVVITPDKVYETYSAEEGPRRIVLRFTATGPMWNSLVDVIIPEELDGISSTQLSAFQPSGSLTPTGHSGHLRLVNIGGSEVSINLDATNGTMGVDDGDGDASGTVGTNVAQNIRINIKAMNKNQGFEIIYYSEIPDVISRTAVSDFIVRTDTAPPDPATTSIDVANAIPVGNSVSGVPAVATPTADPSAVTVPDGVVAHASDNYVTGGRLRPKNGSGTMMAMPMYAETDSGVKRFELRYTAATRLRNADLMITIPEELLGTASTPMALQPANLFDEVADNRNSSEAGYVYAIDRHAASNTLQITLANGTIPATPPTDRTLNTIKWNELNIEEDQVFRTVVLLDTSGTVDSTTSEILDPDDGENNPDRDVPDDGVYPVYTNIDTAGGADTPLEAESDASIYAVRSRNVDVTFVIDTDAATAGVQPGDHIEYNAASKQMVVFQFTAENTAIKGGSVSFRVPNGWTRPVAVDADNVVAGEVSAAVSTGGTIGDISPGVETTIPVTALPQDGTITVTYRDAIVQHNADTVDIIGEFRASPADRIDRRAGRIEVEVLNVEDGSGTATMSTGTSPPYTVRAGRVHNTITVTFTAAGTMNGGQVALERPNDWGDMQEEDADEPNYVTVTANGGTLDPTNASYVGREVAIANLEDFGKTNTVTFTISNAEAPSDLGVDAFVVKSAGSRDGLLTELVGDGPEPADATDADLLGQIYWEENSTADADKTVFNEGTDMRNGRLRVEVVSAADGTGTAMVEIRSSNNDPAKYDGSDTATQEVHAGDDAVYLLFAYTPSETISDGELRFTVPTNWSLPQEHDQGVHGYTYFEEVRNADIGAAVFTAGSRTVTVEIIHMTKDDAIQIHYGWHGIREGGAEAPKVAKPSDSFGFQIKGSKTGSPDSIDVLPTVKVREQASGAGTATIDPETATAGGMGTFTITYTAVGEIKDGTLRLEVPDKWSDTTDENIKVDGGGGSVDRGRQYYDEAGTAFTDNPDHVPGIRQVIVSGIRLAASGQVVFTYETQVGPAIKDDETFNLAFQGGEGPGLDPDKPYAGLMAVKDADGNDLIVEVEEAAAGTGELDVMHDAITASTEDSTTSAEITFIYTATGAIDYPGTFAVRVPAAWSEADPAAGDYTVAYQNAAGVELRGTAQSVEEGAQDARDAGDDRDLIAKIRGANSPQIGAGNRVVFTYTSDAPDTPGSYDFTVLYDDEEVGDLTVNVLSAKEATTVELASSASLDGTDTSVAITISLVDDTGTAATMSTSLSVVLSSDVATGMFSDATDGTYAATLTVLIAAGQTEMMVYYQDASGDAATVTATSGLPEVTVEIMTDVLKIVAGSASVTITDSAGVEKSAAALGDTVTVTAMANGAPTFSIGGHVTERPMSETATAGTYSGTWSPANDLQDGTHTVTVDIDSIIDTEPETAGQITVDTKAPAVEVTVSAEADTITIEATVTDTTDVTITAAVSMQDSEEADSVALSDDNSDGIYEATHTASDGVYDITVTATDAAGNEGMDTATVTIDNDVPVITVERDMLSVMTGGMATISVTLSEAATVSADVSMLNAAAPTLLLEDADGDGVYENTVEVTAAEEAADIAIEITAEDAAGNMAEPASVMVTIDNTDPVITAEDMPAVMTGDEATISVTLGEAAAIVSADVSMLNAAAPTLILTDADGDGVYEGKVPVTADDAAADADIKIAITAKDAAGNEADGTVTVTIDNTAPVITEPKIDMPSVMMGGMAIISATLSEAAGVSADVSMLNAAAPTLVLEDADGDGVYEGTVTVTTADAAADGDIAIAINATDGAGNMAEPASVMVTLDNTKPVITEPKIDMPSVMMGGMAIISATLSEAADVSADVSMLNAAAPTLTLMDADGDMVYEGKVMVTAEGDVPDIEIAITAEDAAGNMAEPASVSMVTLDNTAPEVTGEDIDMPAVMAGDAVTISATVEGATSVSADVTALNAAAPTLPLEDTDGDGVYEGTVTVTTADAAADGDIAIAITATDAAGNTTEPASVMVTLDNTKPVITGEDIDMPSVMMGGMATISATLSEAATVEANVTALNAAAPTLTLTDTDSDGVYEGTVTVTAADAAADGDIAIAITAADAAGNTAEPASVTVTLDNTKPVITEPLIDMSAVMAGDAVTISATLSEAATVSADVSMLNAAAPTLTLTDADGTGMYSGTVTVTADDAAADGDIAIAITAEDAAGNTAEPASVTVTLDNTKPVITEPLIDMSAVMMGDAVTISATLSEAATVSADVSMLNAAAPTLSLTDADGTGMYSGTVTVTADGDVADIAIAITAADAAGNTAEPASVMVALDNTAPVITEPLIDMSAVMMGDMVTISATLSEAATVSADVSMLNAAAPTLTLTDADGTGMYSGTVMVTAADAAADGDIAIAITAADAAGNTAEPASVMVTLDNTAPEVTGESIDMSAVMAGDAVTISAMVTEASTVSADVSMLNAAAPTLTLTDADGTGMYSGTVMVTADGNADNIAIAITAEDAAGNMGMASVMVTLDNTMPEVTEPSIDMSAVMMGDAVTISAMVSEAATVSADVSMLNAAAPTLTLTDADGTGMYSGTVMVTADGDAANIAIAITAEDAAGNTGTASVMVTLDNTAPEVTDVSGSPSPARNGHEVTISAAVSEAATVTADVSMLDTTQTEMVTLTDDDGDGTYTGSFTISEENEADNGSREVTVTATDAAGNSGAAAGSVDLINTLDYTSMIPQGISLFHVPLDVTAIDGSEASLSMVSDLYKALGDAVNYIISTEDGVIWNSYLGGASGDAAITADRGLVVVMSDEKTIKFTGNAWGEDVGPGAGEGASMITLRSGLNLVGLPVNDVSVSKVSDIMNLPEFAGKVTSMIVSTNDGKFASVTVGGIGDDDVRGDASYLVFSSADATQPVTGEGWSNGEMAGAAPIALFGHKVDNQTAALFVEGSIVDELTGLAREGFRIKVKNLSTKAALNTISQGDVAQGGYNMTFVDTKAGNAARIGDVLEISADSPNPFIGVKPVRHIVTVDDVKNSRIQLEDLIAYEIPAETELLRNYPNPFNPETWIPYRLAEDTDVSLTIYDVNGEMVRSIDVGHQTAAMYESRAKAIYWDGRNRFGEQVASGIYFYHLSAGDFSATRKMVILK